MVTLIDEYYGLFADRVSHTSLTKEGIYDIQYPTQWVCYLPVGRISL